MATMTRTVAQHKDRTIIPSVVTLALWRWRQSWYLLLLTGLGIAAAIMIVCALPLFSQVTATAGLRSALSSTPTTSEFLLDTNVQGLSTQLVQDLQDQFNPLFQQPLKGYLGAQTQFSIQVPGLTISSPAPPQAGDQMQFVGASLSQASSHVMLVQGRLPQANSNEIEIALTPASARSLHVTAGSLISVQFPFLTRVNTDTITRRLDMRVVGIFTTASSSDPFWHGTTFQPTQAGQWTTYTALIPNEALISQADSLARANHLKAIFTLQTYNLRWYYHLDPTRVTISQLDDLSNKLALMQSSIANKYGHLQGDPQAATQYPYLQKVAVSGATLDTSDSPGILEQYRSRISLARIPVAILTLQVMALILIFVSMMAEQLVDRQLDAIAVLRSRGASSDQVFGSLVTQGMLTSLVALIIGPLLALVVVGSISERLLSPADLSALTPLTNAPLQAVLGTAWFAVAAALVAVVALVVSLNRATRLDVLLIRRESARSTHRPLWQRLHLDIIAAIIALSGYGISLYITNIGGLLDIRTRALISAPLALVAPIFLLIACVLLFLRAFPYLLQLGALLAVRGRGVASMLALAQMARAPRQALRMTLLLALATAFAVFTLVFNASQSQRALDIAAYQAGADFSGDIPAARLASQDTPASVTALYQHISGVRVASAGFTTAGAVQGASPPIHLQVEAVDPQTFSHAASWPRQTLTQPLGSLMAQLASKRDEGIQNGTLPVIVDAVLWNALDLHTGSTFSITLASPGTISGEYLQCIAVGKIDHLPTVIDSTDEAGTPGATLQSGLLADYQSANTIYQQVLKQNANPADQQASQQIPPLPINHVWLHTQDDPAALSHVRTALDSPDLRLDNLVDSHALLASMQADPLYLNLIGVLTLGAATALLLAIVGSLLASWLNARTRQTGFAVLRALGTSPAQVASVLTWEQAIIYVTAVLLGLLFGALLSVTVVPALTFASVPINSASSDYVGSSFYALQRILPTQIVVPLSLSIAFIVFVILCIVALTLMVRVVSRPSLGQALRLNED